MSKECTSYTSSNHAGYKKLGCYYGNSMLSPDYTQSNVASSTLVPQWGGIGYDALSKGSNCNGKSYNTVNTAYGDCSNDARYTKKACDMLNCK